MNMLKSMQKWGEAAYRKESRNAAEGLEEINRYVSKVYMRATALPAHIVGKLRETKGQGTTEYAILVGVLVVIAIIAVIAFKDKLQSLWQSITSGINNL